MAPGGSSLTGQMSMVSGTGGKSDFRRRDCIEARGAPVPRGRVAPRIQTMGLATMRIRLLGGFSVEVDGASVEDRAWRLRKARSVVKVAALSPGRRIHRDVLAELL